MSPSIALALGLLLIWAASTGRGKALVSALQSNPTTKPSDQNTTQHQSHNHTDNAPGLSAGTWS